jgi:transglutaminase-like putative cysteine protease
METAAHSRIAGPAPDTDALRVREGPPPEPGGLTRFFQVSLVCTLATAFLVLASTGRLDKPAVILFSGALLTRLLMLAWHGRWVLSAKVVTALSVAYLAFYPLDLAYLAAGSSLADRMLIATVHLALFASAIKVLSASTDRDYFYLAALSFVMMLAAAILTVAALYLAGFCLYILFAISTLLSFEVSRLQRHPSALPDSRRPEEESEAHRVRSTELALGKAALGLTVALLPLAALLFFVIPRYRSGYWWRTGFEPQRITGFSENVDLSEIGRILRSDQVVMRVAPEGDAPAFAGEKLRGVALANFDGQRWSNADRREHALMPFSVDAFRPPDFSGLATRPGAPLRYRVLLEPLSTSVLFVAGRAREIDAHLRFMLADHTGSLLDPAHLPGPFTYEVTADSGLPDARVLRAASPDISQEVRDSYLGLPRLDPRISQLARRVTASRRNNYDRAVVLQNYLQGHFTYSLDLEDSASEDPIANFLFRTKRGNCEFFAASMAVMLRSLGIATRLVNGFQMGSYNPVGKDFVVRGYDAHSWVEVYFPKVGWVPFDPTPSGAGTGASLGLLQGYLDAAQLFWSEWIVNYDVGRQIRLAAALESTSRNADRHFRDLRWSFARLTSGPLANGREWLRRHRINTLALVIILLAFSTLAVRHPAWLKDSWAALVWRLAARRGAGAHHGASLAYKRFLVALARRGFEKAPAETPLEFAGRLRDPDLRHPAVDFTRMYQAARFGGQAIASADLDSALEAALKAFSTRPAR